MHKKQIEIINWLKTIKRRMHDSPGSLFIMNSKIHNSFWQDYCDVNERLAEVDLPPIELPDEMYYPLFVDYYLEGITENYTKWYKRTYKEFCEKMKEAEKILDDYISEYGDLEGFIC